MSEHIIKRVTAPVDWSMVPALPISHRLWCPEVPIRAEAKICYDENALYLQLSAQEKNIRAENFGVMDSPCEDSCLEFFFCPNPESPRYFNIEVNPNGCIFLGFGTKGKDLTRLFPLKPIIVPDITRFDGGWQVAYDIPFSFIQLFVPEFRGVSGDTVRANFYKCGDLTLQEHYFAAFPIDLSKPNFHCPEFFATLRFE